MDPMLDAAAELGLAAHAPLLPGHGTHARDLARTGFEDWYAAAAAALTDLTEAGPAVVVGQSMGAVISLYLAARLPQLVCGLALSAPATHLYAPMPATALDVLGALGCVGFNLPKFGGANIGDPEGKRRHLNYSASPARSALSLQRAGRAAVGLLDQIHCPTLILHGAGDGVCPPHNAWEIADRLATAHVEVVILDNSRHILTKDLEAVSVQGHFKRFLAERKAAFAARV